MTFDYLFWGHKSVPHSCRLEGLLGVEDYFEIDEGVSRILDFDQSASFKMNPDFPDDTLTPDQLRNRSAFIVVSARVRAFLEARELPKIEYLPLTIYDHRERPVPSSYCIVNPLGTFDVLDRDACDITLDYTGKSIEQLERFIVRSDVDAALPPLMRIAMMSSYLVVKRELAEAMQTAGFTGMGFIEPGEIAGVELDPSLDLD